jgi:hypothetical protein
LRATIQGFSGTLDDLTDSFAEVSDYAAINRISSWEHVPCPVEHITQDDIMAGVSSAIGQRPRIAVFAKIG